MRSTHEPVAAVILAAGDSLRMGYPKALLPLGDGTFLSRIARTLRAAGLADISVVVGRHADDIRRCAADPGLVFLVNRQPDLGQISSIQLALRNMGTHHGAALIWPVDQPFVSETLVRGLIRLYHKTGAAVVLPTHRGTPGHPAVFRRDLCESLLAWPPGASPKHLIRHHMQHGAFLPTEEAGVAMDIDTPDDYRNLVGIGLEEALSRMGGRSAPE